MTRHEIVQYLLDNCIVAIVRADKGGDALVKIVEAIAAGGVKCIEVTMTTPGALECIKTATEKLKDVDVLIGVGSVLDAETARLAILAGAEYVVCPITSEEVIRMAHRYGKPVMPGAFTPNEIFKAWELGGDIIKIFPATLGGLEYIKAVRAPMPQIPVIPTGGVDLSNLAEFMKAGISGVGIGSALVRKDLVANEDYVGLTALAKQYADAFQAAKAAL